MKIFLTFMNIIIEILNLINSIFNNFIKHKIIQIKIRHMPYDLIIQPVNDFYNESNKIKFQSWLDSINGKSEPIDIFNERYYGINIINKDDIELLPFICYGIDEEYAEILKKPLITLQGKKNFKCREYTIIDKIKNKIKIIMLRLLNTKKHYTVYKIAKNEITLFNSILNYPLSKNDIEEYYNIVRTFINKSKVEKYSFDYWFTVKKCIDIIFSLIDNKTRVDSLNYSILFFQNYNNKTQKYITIYSFEISISTFAFGLMINFVENKFEKFLTALFYIAIVLILFFVSSYIPNKYDLTYSNLYHIMLLNDKKEEILRGEYHENNPIQHTNP